MSTRKRQQALRLALLVGALVFAGCRQDMHDQPRIEPLEVHDFFTNHQGSRPVPAGTVPWGHLNEDTRYYEGKEESGEFVKRMPVEVDRDLLLRGQQRFEIFCSLCHDSTGSGQGMIVRRGFKQPQPLYEQRLVDMPDGYFFDVMTNGFGVMSSYARQVPVEDRWAIVAYVRALQMSQNSRLDDLPADLQADFHQALEKAAEAAEHHDAGHGSAEEHH